MGETPKQYELRNRAFEVFLQGPMCPRGVDRLTLDIAFKAGWVAHKEAMYGIVWR